MKPGLYVATVRGVEGVMVIGPSSEDRAYRTSEPINGLYYHEAPQVTDARPLVVLDPEGDEDAAVVADLLGTPGSHAVARNILRALAAPTPAEPMGLGAVVTLGTGQAAVRTDTVGMAPWVISNMTGRWSWATLEAKYGIAEVTA